MLPMEGERGRLPQFGFLAFVSGQVAVDGDGKIIGARDIRAQAVQVFENLQPALAGVGATMIGVDKLVEPGLLLEIEAIAAIG